MKTYIKIETFKRNLFVDIFHTVCDAFDEPWTKLSTKVSMVYIHIMIIIIMIDFDCNDLHNMFIMHD